MTFQPGAANFFEEVVYDGCSRPFWVYLKTGLPAFIELWFTLSILDFEDIVRSRGFSESGKDLGKGRRGRRHGGLKLPKGDSAPIKRYDALGLRTLLILTIPLEVVGFGLLLYHATDQFFYRWTSLIEQIQCSGASNTLMRSGTDVQVIASHAGRAVALPQVVNVTGSWELTAFGTSIGFGVYDVVFTMTLKGDKPINPAEYTIALFCTGTLQGPVVQGTSGVVGGGRGATLMLSTVLINPSFLQLPITWVLQGPEVPSSMLMTAAHFIIRER